MHNRTQVGSKADMSNTPPLVPPAAGVPQTADPGAGYGRDGQ
jgi:hypothetical protein